MGTERRGRDVLRPGHAGRVDGRPGDAEHRGRRVGPGGERQPASGPTLRDVKNERQEADLAAAKSDPLVKAILDMFPGSSVKVTKREEQVPDTAYEDIFMEEREDE